jgi:hypothetical protein
MSNNDTTLDNQDVDVNVSEEEMFDTLADGFFEEEDLPEQVDEENTVDEAAEENDEEAEASETDELESDDEEDDESEEEGGEDLPEDADLEELDMEYLVPIKIDGEEGEVSIEELIRGYQTAQHANKKSIEASEQIKSAQAQLEGATKLKEQNAELLKNQVNSDEQQLAAYDRKINQLIADDDMYDLPRWQEARRIKAKELGDKKQEADQLKTEAEAENQQALQQGLETARQAAISTLDTDIPGWQNNYEDVVNWAVKDLGFPSFAEVTDAKIIALMYDYKALKDGKKTAISKRKKAPTKSVKATKSVGKKAKGKEKKAKLRQQVLSGDATEGQRDAFLDDMVDGMFN